MIFLLIVLGGMLQVTGSGGACLDWPTCFGRWTPPAQPDATLDYLHRVGTFLAAVLIAASAYVAWRQKQERWARFSLYTATALLALQIGLGALVALRGNPVRLAPIHLGLSLVLQAAVLAAAVIVFYRQPDAARNVIAHPVYRSPFARLSLFVLVGMFVLFVSGSFVAASGAAAACRSWPLCSGLALPVNSAQWINTFHRGIVLLVGLLVVAQFFEAWRTQRTQTPVLVATTAVGVLFLAQALMGAKLVQGFPSHLILLHKSTAAAVWAALIIQVLAVGMSGCTAEAERSEAETFAGRKGLLKDFLMLTKPIVVALLLVTTFAGMVIGARAWPSLSVTFWTLLGGFLAAGGSGAINQYLDRYDDEKMQRTQKRPIPSGRLTPGEGLAFGVGTALASFYFMVAFVNFLAALLTLAGIIYYVLIYSIFLKKTTVQNIVIGGGAGAIPPLVGWAAATGSLTIPSLFLFAVVFMWTPPHFWALALVRRKDYARAGVPMLPVVRGERETRWQIFLYTVELVALTLLLPLFGLGSSLYLIGAALLGGLLLVFAWRVWRQGGNKAAWMMYRQSSMYLAFLFLVLMVDALMK
jgi:protoheme IX farnesyltransferase